MVLLGIGTQAHVIDVGLHLSPSRNQLLYKRPAPQYIPNFVHQFLEESRGVSYPKWHDLPFKYTTLRGYKGQQFPSCGIYVDLTETTVFINFVFIPAYGNTLKGVFHVGNTPGL